MCRILNLLLDLLAAGAIDSRVEEHELFLSKLGLDLWRGILL